MIIVMKVGSPEQEVKRISDEMSSRGFTPEKIVGQHKVVIGLVGETASLTPCKFKRLVLGLSKYCG